MKQIKNNNIKRASFEDVFFVRMKIQQSIRLPKYSPKTSKQGQAQLKHHLMYGVFPYFYSKPQPFIQRVKKQEIKLSKDQIDKWINQKQAEIKQTIQRQNHCGSLFIKPLTSEDKIFLRSPSEVHKLNQLAKQRRLKQNNNQPFLTQLQSDKRYSLQRNGQADMSFDGCMTEKKNVEQKITVFPVLLKIKEINRTKATQNGTNSSFQSDTKNNGLNLSMHAESAIFSKDQSQRGRKTKHSENFISQKLKNKNRLKRSLSFVKQQQSISQSLSPFKSPLYQHKAKAPEPLKQYSRIKKQSETIQKDLANKYSELQNRLDNILRLVNQSKKSTDP